MSTNNSLSRLGRGLDSLIPTDIDEFAAPSMPKELVADGARVEEISPSEIKPNPHQPRTEFKIELISEMAESIKQHGIVQPLVVVRDGSGFQLIAGERRLRAAKQLGLSTVPVIVRSYSQQEQLEVALIENIQRSELGPLELASAYAKLVDQFNLKYEEIAPRVGKAVSTVSNIIRLLNLPYAAKQALNDGRITEGHARTILSVTDPANQQVMLDLIIKKNLTVRQAEELARGFKEDGEVASKNIVEKQTYSAQLSKDLAKHFKTKVNIQKTARGGRVVIEFNSDKELNRLYKQIIG